METSSGRWGRELPGHEWASLSLQMRAWRPCSVLRAGAQCPFSHGFSLSAWPATLSRSREYQPPPGPEGPDIDTSPRDFLNLPGPLW